VPSPRWEASTDAPTTLYQPSRATRLPDKGDVSSLLDCSSWRNHESCSRYRCTDRCWLRCHRFVRCCNRQIRLDRYPRSPREYRRSVMEDRKTLRGLPGLSSATLPSLHAHAHARPVSNGRRQAPSRQREILAISGARTEDSRPRTGLATIRRRFPKPAHINLDCGSTVPPKGRAPVTTLED
jgi:hypothetical protein